MDNNRRYAFVYAVAVSGVLLLGGVFGFHISAFRDNLLAQVGSFRQVPVSTPAPRLFPEVEIEAASAAVYDLTSGTSLYRKNAYQAQPLASLAKIMTALVAAETAPLYTLISINRAALNEEGDSGLIPQEVWMLRDLLDFTLTVSSNDGAHGIASAIGGWQSGTEDDEEGRAFFIQKMNERAFELGLSTMSFKNETGLDLDPTTPGAIGSAEDMAELLGYIYRTHPTLLLATKEASFTVESRSRIHHNASNTNDLAGRLPGLRGGKTGYTDLAGGNLAVLLDIPQGETVHPVAIVVLHGTLEGRFKDTEELSKATAEYLSHETKPRL